MQLAVALGRRRHTAEVVQDTPILDDGEQVDDNTVEGRLHDNA